MLFHCTSPDSFLFHTYTIQSQSQFNLNKIYFSCSNQIYADSHNRLSCLERLLRQFIDHCSVLQIFFFYASCPVWVVLPTEYHFCYTSGILLLFYLNFWTICPKAAFLFFVHERTKKSIHAFTHKCSGAVLL